MKNKVLKWLLFLIPIIYLFLIYFTMYSWSKESFTTEFWILFLSTIVFGIINIIFAVILIFKNEKQLLLTCGALIKSASVTAYALVFLYALAGTTILTIFIGFLSSIIALIFFILDVMMLVVSSSYMIGYLILDYKENKKKSNIVHGILQFIFVLDVFDTFALILTKEKKYKVFYVVLVILAIIIPIIVVKIII